MTSREDWRTLVPELETWATVTVLGDGRLQLRAGGATRELRLTPDEWDDIEGVLGGGDTAASAMSVKAAWDRATEEQGYLVYDGQYDVQPSATPQLPVEPEEARFRQYLAENPPKGDDELGWFA